MINKHVGNLFYLKTDLQISRILKELMKKRETGKGIKKQRLELP